MITSDKIRSRKTILEYLKKLPESPERDCLIQEKEEQIASDINKGDSYQFTTNTDKAILFHKVSEIKDVISLAKLLSNEVGDIKQIIKNYEK